MQTRPDVKPDALNGFYRKVELLSADKVLARLEMMLSEKMPKLAMRHGCKAHLHVNIIVNELPVVEAESEEKKEVEELAGDFVMMRAAPVQGTASSSRSRTVAA
jgi:hypothetical protein